TDRTLRNTVQLENFSDTLLVDAAPRCKEIGLNRVRPHSQERLRTLEENCPSNLQRIFARVLALPNLFRQHPPQLLPDQNGLGIAPFGAICVREKADLPIYREHIQTFRDHLPNHVRKEVVPPVAGQAQVWQFSCQRTERLIRMAARKKTLKSQAR